MPNSPSNYNELKASLAPQNQPKNIQPYQYWAKVTRVVDGDTLDLDVQVGFNMSIAARVRLLGINTPEIYSVKKGSEEYQKGQEAIAFLNKYLEEGSWVEVKIFEAKRDKYGRWLAEIFVGDINVNQEMINAGYEHEY